VPEAQAVCAPQDALYEIALGSSMGFSQPVDLSAEFTPPSSMTAGFSIDPVVPPGSSTLTVGNTGSANEDHYDILVTGAAVTKTHSITLGLDVYAGLAMPQLLLTPADGATDQPVQPVFTWSAEALPVTYDLQIALDEGFTQVVEAASGLTQTQYSPALPLDTAERYFWRVRTNNACGEGEYSAPFSFSTVVLASDCPVGYDPLAVYSQGFEGGEGGWMHSGDGDTWGLSDVRTHSGTWALNADDPTAQISDQRLISPQIELPGHLSQARLQFWNYQSLEDRSGGCYDGGLLEISTDGGASWSPVETGLLTDGYDGPVASGYGNPLAGRNAWCGDPDDWTHSVVELSGYAGESVQLRFRLGSDNRGVVNREGWYLDDVEVQSCVLEEVAVSWSGDSQESGAPGEVVTHTLELNNLGQSESYGLELSGYDWPTEVVGATEVVLEAGASAQVEVRVQVPEGVGEAVIASDSFTLTARSVGDPLISAEASGLTNAEVAAGVSVTVEPGSGSAAPGGTAVYEVEVTNTGEYTDTFSLSAEGEWVSRLSAESSGELGPGESVVVELEVDVPEGALLGESDQTEVTVVSGLDGEVRQTLTVQTLAAYWQLFMPMVIHD
jgi:hypothetical protein